MKSRKLFSFSIPTEQKNFFHSFPDWKMVKKIFQLFHTFQDCVGTLHTTSHSACENFLGAVPRTVTFHVPL